MENPERGGRRNRNPLATANLLSKLFLCWLTPLMHRGNKQRLNESDMYGVLPEDRSEKLGENLQRIPVGAMVIGLQSLTGETFREWRPPGGQK